MTRQNQAIGQTKDLLLIKYVFRSYGLWLQQVDESAWTISGLALDRHGLSLAWPLMKSYVEKYFFKHGVAVLHLIEEIIFFQPSRVLMDFFWLELMQWPLVVMNKSEGDEGEKGEKVLISAGLEKNSLSEQIFFWFFSKSDQCTLWLNMTLSNFVKIFLTLSNFDKFRKFWWTILAWPLIVMDYFWLSPWSAWTISGLALDRHGLSLAWPLMKSYMEKYNFFFL